MATYRTEKEAALHNKMSQPTETEIRAVAGEAAWRRLERLEALLTERYQLERELRFPFGNGDGWGFRYSHKQKLLFYMFFEESGFICTISISSKAAGKMEGIRPQLLPETQKLWENRYPCGEKGGWIHYHITADAQLDDVVRLVEVRVRPQHS